MRALNAIATEFRHLQTRFDDDPVGTLDRQAVVDDNGLLDFDESVVENLREAGVDAVRMVVPDATALSVGGTLAMTLLLGPFGGLALAMLPVTTAVGVGLDVADIAIRPLSAAKNLGDAAVHGALAGVDRLMTF